MTEAQIEPADDPRNHRIEDAIAKLRSIANTRNRKEVEFAISVLEEYQNKTGQAYQVIGTLAHYGGLFDDDGTMRALDYFSHEGYEDDFLPWYPQYCAKNPKIAHRLAGIVSYIRRLW